MVWDPKQPDDWAELRAANRNASRQADPAEQPEAPAPAVQRKYEVVGSHAVFGNEPGSVVDLTLTEGEERALIESGHLVPSDEVPGSPALEEVEEVAVAVESATVEAHQEDDLSQ